MILTTMHLWNLAASAVRWSRLKAELIQDGVFHNLEDARTELFEYIECYYNRKRKHSSLGYKSPAEFENEYYLNLSKTTH